MTILEAPDHISNGSEYRSRMSKVPEKYDHIPIPKEGETILDVGCADGSLLNHLGDISTTQYVGFDNSPKMIAHARREHPGYTFVPDLEYLKDRKFTYIILSSVLHEVYSYGGFDADIVVEALVDIKKYLKYNGQIIIRDGIIPDPSEFLYNGKPFLVNDRLTIEVADADEIQDALYVIKHAGQCKNVTLHRIPLGDATLSGPLDEMITFFNIVTWGWASMPREKNECVNFATFGEWEDIMDASNLRIIHYQKITQTDYLGHLNRYFYIDENITWPTKIIIEATPLQDGEEIDG